MPGLCALVTATRAGTGLERQAAKPPGRALIALGRLDAISTRFPDARLFVYSYAGHGAGSDRPRTQPRVYLRCLHPHVKSGNKLRNDNDIVQKTWNLCDVLRDDALALRLRRGLDIGMAEIVS
jgi:hypothetical protein